MTRLFKYRTRKQSPDTRVNMADLSYKVGMVLIHVLLLGIAYPMLFKILRS